MRRYSGLPLFSRCSPSSLTSSWRNSSGMSGSLRLYMRFGVTFSSTTAISASSASRCLKIHTIGIVSYGTALSTIPRRRHAGPPSRRPRPRRAPRPGGCRAAQHPLKHERAQRPHQIAAVELRGASVPLEKGSVMVCHEDRRELLDRHVVAELARLLPATDERRDELVEVPINAGDALRYVRVPAAEPRETSG